MLLADFFTGFTLSVVLLIIAISLLVMKKNVTNSMNAQPVKIRVRDRSDHSS